ncbi:MAG: HemK2/MTQ2 family protein methyltransferase [Acidimicrobiales bacterium]
MAPAVINPAVADANWTCPNWTGPARIGLPAEWAGQKGVVVIVRSPSVYPPQGDTWLLARALRRRLSPGARVLDLCTGSGALAMVAARCPGTHVTAIDLSAGAVAMARVNSAVRGLRVEIRRGDLFEPVAGRLFDLIVANPPYVPAADDQLPRRGRARAWDAGLHGRALLDRICDQVGDHLAPGGQFLVVFSSVCDVHAVTDRLGARGLEAHVVSRCAQPFGPVFSSRAGILEERGLILPGQRTEELVVVHATACV